MYSIASASLSTHYTTVMLMRFSVQRQLRHLTSPSQQQQQQPIMCVVDDLRRSNEL